MHYYSLISSLPALIPDGDSGITPEKFLSDCKMYVGESDFRILEDLSLDPVPGDFPKGSFARKYSEWECALRNAIVRFRSGKLGLDPVNYLNREAGVEADAERAVSAAYTAGSPLERERILDHARWTKIEELEFGNNFSFEQLCGYKLKLLIQEKWLNRNRSEASNHLDQAVSEISAQRKL